VRGRGRIRGRGRGRDKRAWAREGSAGRRDKAEWQWGQPVEKRRVGAEVGGIGKREYQGRVGERIGKREGKGKRKGQEGVGVWEREGQGQRDRRWEGKGKRAWA
jgi:hypothetical protein